MEALRAVALAQDGWCVAGDGCMIFLLGSDLWVFEVGQYVMWAGNVIQVEGRWNRTGGVLSLHLGIRWDGDMIEAAGVPAPKRKVMER